MRASPFPKIALCMLLCLAISAPLYVSASVNTINQLKEKWITVEIPKYEDGRFEALLQELRSQEEKIGTVTFNEETRRLTVYYANFVSYDDILQIINKYYQDFKKVGGTEL